MSNLRFLEKAADPISSTVLDWQTPCITEKRSQVLHQDLSFTSKLAARTTYFPVSYLGLPWATYIDRNQLPHTLFEALRSKLHSQRLNAARTGVHLEIHTVCQHIWWEKLLPIWHSLGLTDIHLSHLPESGISLFKNTAIRFHPWHLYAVNVEDPTRREGLVNKPLLIDRRYLASFIGAHGPNYISDVRQRLLQHSGEPDCLIEVTGTRWHFEGIVYDHQVRGQAYDQSLAERESIRRYNEILSESQFALCPSGTGPNSLRLWEAMALGCIPVLLGKRPALPDLARAASPEVPDFKWQDSVVAVEDDEVPGLIRRLRAMSPHERQLRSIRAKQAYSWVRNMRCFDARFSSSDPRPHGVY